jgi:hypothetical protein
MIRKITHDAAEVEEAGEPEQGVTLSIPTHMAAPSHALVLREGAKPTPHPTRDPAPRPSPSLGGAARHSGGRDAGRARRAGQAHTGARYSDHEPAEPRSRSSSCRR